jgi:hypothetical protein
MNITFVVQGPVVNNQEITSVGVVESIRYFYPRAEIILSTWEGEDISGINYDKLILNKDPGFFRRNDGLLINVNRQIISTLEGLKLATNDIVVKIRTDTIVTNNLLCQIFQNNKKAKYFENYLIITELFTRDPLKINLLFHPSDLLLLGKKNDLIRLFSISLAEKHELINEKGISILAPEQYIWLKYLFQFENLNLFNRLSPTTMNIILSEKLLHSNFLILKDESLGIKFTNRINDGWQKDKVHNHKLSRFYFKWSKLLGVLIITRIYLNKLSVFNKFSKFIMLKYEN